MEILPEKILRYGVELQALRQEHIEMVRQWRNHPEVAKHMVSDSHITPDQQQEWFRRVGGAKDRNYYIIYVQGEPTGFASVTAERRASIDSAEALEAAIYFSPDSPCRGNLTAFAPALALNDACFALPKCRRLMAQVKEENAAALGFNKAMGYQEVGRESGMILIELCREDYDSSASRIKALLSRTPGK